MKTKEENPSDLALSQGCRHGTSTISGEEGLRGKVPASTGKRAGVGRTA